MSDPTPTTTPGTAPVTDRRTPPRGVMPRGMQSWLMMGLAAAVLAIIAFTGQRAPAPGPRPAATAPAAPSPDRVQEYQARLRAMNERARAARQEPLVEAPQQVATSTPTAATTPTPAAADPLQAERRRREYESLFASNLVMSRRPEARQFIGDRRAASHAPGGAAEREFGAPPTLDEVAEAVMRATSRQTTAPDTAATAGSHDVVPRATEERSPSVRPVSTAAISSLGPLHRVLEGTVIDTVLTHRLDGSAAAPVNCLVTSPVYSHEGQYVLVPAGARVLGDTRPVQAFGETRLAVGFTRLVFPDGSTHRLDEFVALNDSGETGLRDQVNQHYRSTFGASAAVGLLTGFAQSLGMRGLAGGDGDRTVVIAGNVGDATAQATAQMMNRFLNRLPSVTIREGHRVKVYVTSDLELPAYDVRRPSAGALAATYR